MSKNSYLDQQGPQNQQDHQYIYQILAFLVSLFHQTINIQIVDSLVNVRMFLSVPLTCGLKPVEGFT